MELKTLKPKLGRWLSIEELRGFLAAAPDDVCQGVPINRKLLEIASEFVEANNGWWEHPDWESYLDRLDREGFRLTEESKGHIGGILEIFKGYYHNHAFQAIAEKRRKPGNRNTASPRKTAATRRSRTSEKQV